MKFVISCRAEGLDLNDMAHKFREEACFIAYMQCDENQSRAAKWLGIHRNRMGEHLQRWAQRKERG